MELDISQEKTTGSNSQIDKNPETHCDVAENAGMKMTDKST